MPPLLTTNAVIMCAHGGKVTPIPSQAQVLVDGAPALCLPDLVGAPITGCALPPTPVTKPCTSTIAALPGSWSLKVLVVGRPALIATAIGLTDSVPPGTFQVLFPGQVRVEG